MYYADWNDPQLNTSTSNWGFFGVINGESARTQGFEVELSGNFTDALSYSLGYTYADGELTDDVYQPAGNFYGTPGRPVFLDRVAADGDRLPGTAKHVFNVTLRHDVELANGMEMNTVLSGYYQSDVLNSIGDDNCLTHLQRRRRVQRQPERVQAVLPGGTLPTPSTPRPPSGRGTTRISTASRSGT